MLLLCVPVATEGQRQGEIIGFYPNFMIDFEGNHSPDKPYDNDFAFGRKLATGCTHSMAQKLSTSLHTRSAAKPLTTSKAVCMAGKLGNVQNASRLYVQ